MVQSTVFAAKDRIIKEGYPNICALWADFLSALGKCNHGTVCPFHSNSAPLVKLRLVSFPDAVPILLALYIKTDPESDLWKNAYGDFLMLGEHENGITQRSLLFRELFLTLLPFQDPEYIKALEGALPQNLNAFLHGSPKDWPATVKWIKLMVALSKRRVTCPADDSHLTSHIEGSLKESVDKILENISNDVENRTAQIEAGENEHNGGGCSLSRPTIWNESTFKP